MKLTDKTLRILKNFSEINPGITLRKGKRLATVSAGLSTILALANVDDDLPVECSIYNLDKFLALQSLFADPQFEFCETKVVVKSGSKSVEYYYSDPTVVKSPKRVLGIPENKVEFDLTVDDYKTLIKGAAILGYDELVIIGDGKKVTIETTKSNSGKTVGSVQHDTGIISDKIFTCTLSIRNLKILEGNYKVKVDDQYVYFGNKDIDLHYWIVKQDMEGK